VTCETETGGLGALIHALGESNTKAVIATLDSSICEVAAKLAHLGNKPLLTWTCPLVSVYRVYLQAVSLSLQVCAVIGAVEQQLRYISGITRHTT
jgi:hypothetical protein